MSLPNNSPAIHQDRSNAFKSFNQENSVLRFRGVGSQVDEMASDTDTPASRVDDVNVGNSFMRLSLFGGRMSAQSNGGNAHGLTHRGPSGTISTRPLSIFDLRVDDANFSHFPGVFEHIDIETRMVRLANSMALYNDSGDNDLASNSPEESAVGGATQSRTKLAAQIDEGDESGDENEEDEYSVNYEDDGLDEEEDEAGYHGSASATFNPQVAEDLFRQRIFDFSDAFVEQTITSHEMDDRIAAYFRVPLLPTPNPSATPADFAAHRHAALLPGHPQYPVPGTNGGICHDPFHLEHAPILVVNTSGCSGHVFGYQCLRKSISSGMNNSNKCPLCRTVWFLMSKYELQVLSLHWADVENAENRAYDQNL